jgi:hypothetical protein
VKSFLILFAAVAPPALLYAALSETDFAAIRELAPWALMLLGFGGIAVALRAGLGSPLPQRRTLDSPWTADMDSGRLELGLGCLQSSAGEVCDRNCDRPATHG